MRGGVIRKRKRRSLRAAASARGLKSEGGSALWRTLSRQNIGAEIDENLRKKIDNPIVFKYLGTGSESGPGYHKIRQQG